MKIELNLKLKKSIVTIAEITGEVQIKLVAENLAKNYVKDKIINSLKGNGFKGEVITNGQVTKL